MHLKVSQKNKTRRALRKKGEKRENETQGI